MRLLAPALLFGVSLALGAAIAYESFAPLDPVSVEIPHPSPSHVPAIKPVAYAPPAIELFGDLDTRPLFTATRKPLQDATQAAATTPSSDFVLVGVIMGGARAVALLRNKSTSASTSAAVGDMVNGWRVAKIDATTVTLHANGGDFVVPLDSPASQPAGPPLVAPPPPPPQQQPLTPVPAPPPQAAPTAAKPPPQTAATPTPGKPAAPYHPTIDPEALKGAPIDPKTGEPTL